MQPNMQERKESKSVAELARKARKNFKDFDKTTIEFLRQFNERDIRIVPDPNSKEQMEIADEFSTNFTLYQVDVQRHENAVKQTLQKFSDKLDAVHPKEDEDMQTKDVDEFEVHELTEAISDRVESSVRLMLSINKIKAHGMVHDGEGLLKKLKECQEDNRRLSNQILEYKDKLGIKN